MFQAKTTTIKEALKRWEEINQKSASEATEVDLQFQWLPIEKMDNSLSQLVKCECVPCLILLYFLNLCW